MRLSYIVMGASLVLSIFAGSWLSKQYQRYKYQKQIKEEIEKRKSQVDNMDRFIFNP